MRTMPSHGLFTRWAATALAATVMTVTSAHAAGALALGLQNDDPKPGFAAGGSWNRANDGDANYEALRACLSFKEAPLESRVECKVVSTFRNQCFALAFDPQPGTPGFAWAVGNDKASTDRSAIDKCKAVAGADRAQYCAIDLAACDGTPSVVSAAPSPSKPLVSPAEASATPQSASAGRR